MLAERLGESEYAELVLRLQAAVLDAVPAGASVLVLSKGDESLLALPGLLASHFPQDDLGGYAGFHPRDDAEALAQLQHLQRGGAEYLAIPTTGRWWLDFYRGFAEHLTARCELVADVPDACLVYRLGGIATSLADGVACELPQASSGQLRDYLENLLAAEVGVAVLEVGPHLGAALAPLSARSFEPRELEEGTGPVQGLARLAQLGADYLVVPRTADEWLEQRPLVEAEIEACCRKIADQRHLCRVYELKELRVG